MFILSLFPILFYYPNHHSVQNLYLTYLGFSLGKRIPFFCIVVLTTLSMLFAFQ